MMNNKFEKDLIKKHIIRSIPTSNIEEELQERVSRDYPELKGKFRLEKEDEFLKIRNIQIRRISHPIYNRELYNGNYSAFYRIVKSNKEKPISYEIKGDIGYTEYSETGFNGFQLISTIYPTN